MSGIAGFVNFDGAPAGVEFAQAMADALAFRGPHGRDIWCRDSAVLVHTLLKTTFEAEFERQPVSIDGQVWITADARIDRREDLIRALGLPASTLSRPDCELILHAYARWGEACVDHLIGDFAFAIWDSRNRKLFCARDHFGVKPFYYAQPPGTFLFSNTLNVVRMHPDVSDELNELAIADFLVFDYNQDPATTTFQDIQRLPAAHTLTATAQGVTVRRYWSLPEGETIRYRRTRDYVEHFRSLLETAVADRLRTDRVGIMMSGGLDSPSVAAFARKANPETEIQAYTCVYDWLIPDDERHYASLVAKALDIPIQFISMDGARPFNSLVHPTPEPLHYPIWAFVADYRRGIADNTPVVFTGSGADPLFCLSPLMSAASIRAIPLRLTAINFIRYSTEFRAVPKFRLRSTVRNLVGLASPAQVGVPHWLNADFVRRCDIRNRVAARTTRTPRNKLRPSSRHFLESWRFDTEDAAWSSAAIDWRHPYFDTRLIRYLLATPELPFSMDKYLLRTALKDMVPEPVRTRKKTPLRADPLQAASKEHGIGIPNRMLPHPRLRNFINWDAAPTIEGGSERVWMETKPVSLNTWLISQENLKTWKTNATCRFELLTTRQD